MNGYRRRSFAGAAVVSGGAVDWSTLPGRAALAVLIAFSLLAPGIIAVPGHAQAASGGPKIVFAAPIYAGQNNGFAEGPVGTTASVQGSGWTAGGGDVTVTLADEQNDTAGQPGSACTNGSATVTIPGLSSQPVDGAGNFSLSFLWPAGAGTKGHSYWACGTQGATKSTGVDKFTVLSSNPLSLSVSDATQAYPGGSITVSGQNWLPGGQLVSVIVTPCLDCEPGYTTSAQTTAGADGSFTVSVGVPTQAKAGNQLYVIASGPSQAPTLPPALNVNDPSNAPHFNVIAQSTITPTVTVTATSSPTATATSTANGGGGGNSNGSSGSILLLILLAALGVVLLLAAVVSLAFYLRSRNPVPVAPGRGAPPYGSRGGYGPPGGGQYGAPRRTGAPYGPPSYPDPDADYYGEPPPRSGPPGQGRRPPGGWQGNPPVPGPDEGSGDDPTIGMRTPWR